MAISAVTQNSQTLQAAYATPLKSAELNSSLNTSNAAKLDNAPAKPAVDTVNISQQATQLAAQLKKA